MQPYYELLVYEFDYDEQRHLASYQTKYNNLKSHLCKNFFRKTLRTFHSRSRVWRLAINTYLGSWWSLWYPDFNSHYWPHQWSSEPYHVRYNATLTVEESTIYSSATITLPTQHWCLWTLFWNWVPYVTVQWSSDGWASWSTYDTTEYCQDVTHIKFLFMHEKHDQVVQVWVHMQSPTYEGADACFTTTMDAYNAQYVTDTLCVTPWRDLNGPVVGPWPHREDDRLIDWEE